MPRQESLDLTRRVLKHFENDTLDTTDDVWREPRGAYVEQDRFVADVEMLRSVPHVIAWAGEVAAPGQYTTKDVMDVPVLVARGKDGVLRAFINGCAHRGAQGADGCGKTRMLQCPSQNRCRTTVSITTTTPRPDASTSRAIGSWRSM